MHFQDHLYKRVENVLHLTIKCVKSFLRLYDEHRLECGKRCMHCDELTVAHRNWDRQKYDFAFDCGYKFNGNYFTIWFWWKELCLPQKWDIPFNQHALKIILLQSSNLSTACVSLEMCTCSFGEKCIWLLNGNAYIAA